MVELQPARGSGLWILVRAATVSTLFVGLVLVLVPALVLVRSGVTSFPAIGPRQAVAMAFAAVGGAIAAWCVLTFVLLGRGTPAPFDPPRRLVVRGPYKLVRNPMYVGAGLALLGAALFFGSLPLLIYTALLGLIVHCFVVFYEEPTLRRTFGDDYAGYCEQVGRWWPKLRAGRPGPGNGGGS